MDSVSGMMSVCQSVSLCFGEGVGVVLVRVSRIWPLRKSLFSFLFFFPFSFFLVVGLTSIHTERAVSKSFFLIPLTLIVLRIFRFIIK
ncbi:hypothetical protein J3F84DRAFT_389135 [Trichoderma pleuroticola]